MHTLQGCSSVNDVFRMEVLAEVITAQLLIRTSAELTNVRNHLLGSARADLGPQLWPVEVA